ncbi:hypothetical protein VTN00DRAFT_5196 [Thermoascus crustaceus]|uniref:uncharacterized protein n=1 Tax=Thermoascus crustaceus TaxID=5088 RepID=UPI0037439213
MIDVHMHARAKAAAGRISVNWRTLPPATGRPGGPDLTPVRRLPARQLASRQPPLAPDGAPNSPFPPALPTPLCLTALLRRPPEAAPRRQSTAAFPTSAPQVLSDPPDPKHRASASRDRRCAYMPRPGRGTASPGHANPRCASAGRDQITQHCRPLAPPPPWARSYRSAEPVWAPIPRAKARGPKSGSGGTILYGETAHGRISHTKWALHVGPLHGPQGDLGVFDARWAANWPTRRPPARQVWSRGGGALAHARRSGGIHGQIGRSLSAAGKRTARSG